MKDKSEIMNKLLQKYFKNLEQYLIKSVEVASASATFTTERGEGAEDFVAKILESHLPTRASVATHRQIIGADTKYPSKRYAVEVGPSRSVDVIVYNEWTTMPNLLNQGYILAESVYLALEVKASAKVSNLRGLIKKAVREQLSLTRVRKRLRPETIYFGNVRKKDELPLMSVRLYRPTNGVIGFLWENSKQKLKLPAKECLGWVDQTISNPKNKKIPEKEKSSPYSWPNVIYVPDQFLAFMVCERAIKEDGSPEELPVLKNEYPFLMKRNEWSPSHPITLPYKVPDYNWEKLEFKYYYLERRNSGLNLLYVFILWLCQEILKFALEIPDYYRYLLPKRGVRLDKREGAMITKDGCWRRAEFNSNNDEWYQA